MLRSSIVRIVAVCTRHPWRVIAFALALGILSGLYAATHFKIKTDVDALISPDLPWAQRAQAYANGFPQNRMLGEAVRIGLCTLCPRQIRRNQSINVGLDLEMCRGVQAAQDPKREGESDDPPGMPSAHRNDPNDRRSQHVADL